MANEQPHPQPRDTMQEIMDRATAEINRNGALPHEYVKRRDGNGQQAEPELGKIISERLRAAAERTANAIEAQAQERMEMAQKQVEEAEKHIAQAKKIADDVRRGGEEEATRAMQIARRLQDSTDLLNSVKEKFEQ